MGFLSIVNFWKYQDKNAWKKSKTHPPWFKHYVHRDRELDRLPVGARLLFHELLGAATRYSNVLEADLNWLYAETRMEPELIAEMLPLLLKGGWLSQTKTRRRGTGSGTQKPADPGVQDVEEDVDEEKNLRARANGKGAYFAFATMIRSGAIVDYDHFEDELRVKRSLLTDQEMFELKRQFNATQEGDAA